MKFKYIIIFVFSLLVFVGNNSFAADTLTIAECLENKFIKTKVRGLGGYQEECIALEIQNISNKDINIVLEPGRRLVSIDTNIQDILIVKEFIVLVKVGQKKEILGYGFCCQASKGGPRGGAKFHIGDLATENLVKLAKVINKNNFPPSAVQHAIWVLSDGHSLSSVCAQNDDIKALEETLADILGIELPWYKITYMQDTALVFSDRPENVFVKFQFYIKNNSLVTINVRNKQGKVMTTLEKAVPLSPGTYSRDLKFDVVSWPKGKYDLFVYVDYGQILLKKEFEL